MQEIDAEIKHVVEIILGDLEGNRKPTPKMPIKTVIIDILNKLQHVLFPGYFGLNHTNGGSLKNRLGVMLEEISQDLIIQVGLALRYDTKYEKPPEKDIDGIVTDIVLKFISKIPVVKEYLETDIEAIYNGDPAAYNKAEIIMSYPGLYACMVYRIAHELYLLSVPLVPRIMSEHAHSITGIDIHPGAAIGKYFCMDHGTGIVIGETTVIGNNVKLYQGVTLGAMSTKGGQNLKNVKRHPELNDNVTVYSGASILGGGTVIGEGVIIGGNAFVVKSVPENTRVSVKNPELQYKNGDNTPARAELDQVEFWYYEI